MLSKVGTLRFSSTNVGFALSGESIRLKWRSCWSSGSFTECSKIVISASSIFGHISVKAFWYVVMKVLYAVARAWFKGVSWSSKMVNAVRNISRKVCVFAGCLAAVMIEVDVLAWGAVVVIVCCGNIAEITCRVCCFDLRTQWYSYQSNRLINR